LCGWGACRSRSRSGRRGPPAGLPRWGGDDDDDDDDGHDHDHDDDHDDNDDEEDRLLARVGAMRFEIPRAEEVLRLACRGGGMMMTMMMMMLMMMI
jgi:hypothetical protein